MSMENLDTASRTVVSTRVVAFPRERVFRAWTDPDLLIQWWGPRGFRNTFHRFEPRPEGTWDFTMHAPDGRDFHNTCVFREVRADHHIVFDHLKEMHFYHAEIELSAAEGGTRVHWTMRFNTAEELRDIRRFIEQANEENLDRLEEVLKAVSR